ncbi:MAG: ribonuclease HII, partial [Alphaproteobacteria bacterium]
MPDYRLERRIGGLVCGIDEVGRGPLAGPVVAAAVVLDPARLPRGIRAEIDDSKRVPPDRRPVLAAALRALALVGVGAASGSELDRCNSLRATDIAR